VEGDYERVDKLLEVRDGARKRLRDTEKELEQEKQVCSVVILVHPEFIVAHALGR